ncbi:MAG: phosphoenolpyruvate--protein phosphotransferase, partial [Pseudomonadota bacterium]
DVLETYRMIAEDRGWLGRIREAIGGGLTAEAAVQKVQNETNARMAQIQDPYLRERVADFQDLANRLMSHLAGTANGDDLTNGNGQTPPHMIVIAETLGPAELLDYDRSRLRGVVLSSGSPTSHVAIVARALDIPVVGRVSDILERVEPGDPVIVDGDNAQVFLRPGDDVQTSFLDSVLARSRRRAAYQALRSLPACTLDGTDIHLQINAGLLVDLGHLEDTGAEGVGLYRTEIPFMVRPDFPDVTEQTELYRRIIEHAGGKPIVFRTLDIGGDKLLPYVQEGGEENPAMGWRAIRIALDRPAILRQQLRALIAACAERPLQVMFPMIAEMAEFLAARRLLDLELKRAADNGQEPPSSVEVGVMLEVPALAYQLPILAEEADFISVGSNDLLQFLFASDRGNPRLAQRYDGLAPPVVSLLRSIAETCAAARGGAGTRLSLCGEMAGNPLEAMALIGLGFRYLSMAAPSIGPVKEMVRSLDVPRLTDYLDSLVRSADHSLGPKLTAFARDHGVVI